MKKGFLIDKKRKSISDLNYYDIITCKLLENPGNIKFNNFTSDLINEETWVKKVQDARLQIKKKK